jgi:hypothetical protein
MKSSRILAALFALTAALAFASNPAHAQVSVITPNQTINVPVVTSPAGAAASVVAPIITRVINTITLRHATPEGSEWLKAEVIHADAVTLIVREQANGLAIHTFNFSSDLQPKMQAMLDKGGFQYGDKVSILYMQKQTVALRVHGKPSKSL